MNVEDRPGGGAQARRPPREQYVPFPPTHWSLVRRAGNADDAARREALGHLLERYLPALRSYLLYVRRLDQDAAEECVQAFVADTVLAKDLLRSADARRGKFRSLLLTSLNNFVISRHRAAGRHPKTVAGPDPDFPSPAPAAPGPFDVEWAKVIVHTVLAAMQDECERTGRRDVWEVFNARLVAVIFNNALPVGYDELATRIGLTSAHQAANLLVTGKRTYLRLLRSAVAEYEPDDDAIDAEISDLHRLLTAGKPQENRRDVP
jgi:RNA polymerase sigma-70 factor (ECF subfamily)